jgi:hypothetical protein
MRSNVYTFLRTVGLTRNKLVPFQIKILHPELTAVAYRMFRLAELLAKKVAYTLFTLRRLRCSIG